MPTVIGRAGARQGLAPRRKREIVFTSLFTGVAGKVAAAAVAVTTVGGGVAVASGIGVDDVMAAVGLGSGSVSEASETVATSDGAPDEADAQRAATATPPAPTSIRARDVAPGTHDEETSDRPSAPDTGENFRERSGDDDEDRVRDGWDDDDWYDDDWDDDDWDDDDWDDDDWDDDDRPIDPSP